MDKCRLCLKSQKNLLSIYESNGVNTYASMITSVANIKILDDYGVTDKICLICRQKLRDIYEFKLMIERSDVILHENCNLKRINFNNINDIKVKVEAIEIGSKNSIPLQENFTEIYFKNGDACVSYNDTVIKKVNACNDTGFDSNSLSLIEFLNTIKVDPDKVCDYDYEVAIDYEPDIDDKRDNDYKPTRHKEKRRYIKKKSRSKFNKDEEIHYDMNKLNKNIENKIKKKDKKNQWFKTKPIKPVYLEDIRLVPTKTLHRKVHKYRSHIKRQDICPYCGKMTTMEAMKKHLLLHTGERKYKCDMCTKGFFDENNLNKHKLLHSTTKNFKCEKCVAAFTTKGSLRNHMLMHSDEKKHVCSTCHKAFKRKATLSRHVMIHNFGNKSIKCELCNMSFFSNYGLRHHMRVHTGERPYKCEICSQPYSYKHDFNRHCFKKHGVFLKRRSVYVMNEEVLMQERALMRELMLRTHGVIKDGKPLNPFEGPQAALAFEQTVKALETRQIPIDYQF